MGSSAQDKSTQKSSSAGAQGAAGTLAQTGNQLQQAGQGIQNTVRTATGGFLNPTSLNVSAPTGAFATQYQTQKNQNAQAADQALASTNRNLASRGMGMTPAGFSAANDLQAYQNQANANQQAFQNATTNSQNQAQQNFWNAANLQNTQANTDISGGLQGVQGAGSIYGNLYGTASQQKQNPWVATAGALGSIGV